MAGKIKVRYDGILLTLLRSAQNENFKLLSKNLLRNSVHWKNMLHHAAFYNNDIIAQHLIDMELDVDALDANGKTPLMIAIEGRSAAVVEVLLEAKASMQITDADGMSALQMIFDSKYFSTKILESILQRLRRDYPDVQELVDKLAKAGCSMYHAAYFRDTQIMAMLLDRGIDINSRGYCKETALHVAVAMNDLNMAEWILDKGGDVEAVNEYCESALADAAKDGKADLVRLLLKRGADPNSRHPFTRYTPLFAVFAFSLHERDQANFDKCAELLLRHGAVPENSSIDHYTLFDFALLNRASSEKIEYVIGQLAILVKLGRSTVESVMISNVEEHSLILIEMMNIYESCRKILELIVYGELSVFDLLTQNESKLRIYVRNKKIRSRLDFVYRMMSQMYPYYSKILKKRISKAMSTVNLEDEVIPIFSKLFNSNYNLYYNIARQVVGYLNQHDLKQLCQV